jgi:hypothetical protein
MRKWHLIALALSAAALLLSVRPAQAQVWVSPGPVFVQPAPVVIAPAPVVVAPAPVVVGPTWGAGPYWGWGARRAYYRPWRGGGWYPGVRGPRGGAVVVGGRRRW